MTLQDDIIATLGVKPEISPAEEVRRSVDFLKDYLKQYPFLKSLVLGISGGQDSSLAGRLAQLAIEELRAETGDAPINSSLFVCLMACNMMKMMLKKHWLSSNQMSV